MHHEVTKNSEFSLRVLCVPAGRSERSIMKIENKKITKAYVKTEVYLKFNSINNQNSLSIN